METLIEMKHQYHFIWLDKYYSITLCVDILR